MAGVTTTRTIYEAILEVLQDQLSSGEINPQGIYLVAAPTFDSRFEQALQVVPGGAVNRSPRSSLPLIDEEFDLVLWFRSVQDLGNVDTEKLTNSTWSAYDTIQKIRGAIIGSDLNAKATKSVRFLRSARPVVGADQWGWIQITDTFSMAYEIEWR